MMSEPRWTSAWSYSLRHRHDWSFEDFRICSRFDNVNHGAWYVYKRLFGSSVATCRLACSEISPSIIGEKLKRSPGKGRTCYNMADGVTASAQLYALYSHRARSFNQWQYVLYPNFIIKTNNRKQDCSCAKKEGAFWNEQTNKTTSKYAKKKISMIITITRQVEKLNMTLD